MKFKKLLAGSLLAATAGAFALNGGVTPSNIYIFGDSLSDAGYQDNLPNLVPFKMFPAVKLPNWTTFDPFNGTVGYPYGPILLNAYGLISLTTTANTQPENNQNPPASNAFVSGNLSGPIYAAGGATTTGIGIGLVVKGAVVYNPPSVQVQINQYLTNHNPANETNAVQIIWAGANNIFKVLATGDTSALPAAAIAAATDITSEVAQLANAGAKHIIVINLPDLGITPLAMLSNLKNPTASAGLTQVSKLFNGVLAAGLSGMGGIVKIVDIFSLMNEVAVNKKHTIKVNGVDRTYFFNYVFGPSGSGFENILIPACGNFLPGTLTMTSAINCVPLVGTVGPESGWTTKTGANFFFTDNVHPSYETHTVIAYTVKNTIDSSWNPGSSTATGFSSFFNFLIAMITGGASKAGG